MSTLLVNPSEKVINYTKFFVYQLISKYYLIIGWFYSFLADYSTIFKIFTSNLYKEKVSSNIAYYCSNKFETPTKKLLLEQVVNQRNVLFGNLFDLCIIESFI
jgi:hypothetical protein